LDIVKGQLISKGLFGVFKSTKKPTIFVRISALACLACKKRLDQKNKGTLYIRYRTIFLK
jgi:hypothetical protein